MGKTRIAALKICLKCSCTNRALRFRTNLCLVLHRFASVLEHLKNDETFFSPNVRLFFSLYLLKGANMKDFNKKMSILLADTYALYLKTQNYHWHVNGPLFKSLHELFDVQYHELADAVDLLAERIRIKGEPAPATFKALDQLKTIKDGDSTLNANQMVTELAQDHDILIRDLNKAIKLAQEVNDEGTANVLAERIEAHEKARWMLNASRQ